MVRERDKNTQYNEGKKDEDEKERIILSQLICLLVLFLLSFVFHIVVFE